MITTSFSEGFYSGSKATAALLIPGKYQHALAGHAYLIDLAPPPYATASRFRHSSIPFLKPQTDTSNIPGEHSLNPEGIWRVSQESWHKGAGQVYVDKAESDPNRFRSSKGILIWNKWEMGLLQDTIAKRSSSNTNLQMVIAGSRVYLIDGASIFFATDLTATTPFSTSVTGGPSTAPISITSDGNNVLTAHGADGIYRTTRTTSTTASYITGGVSLVAYVKDRIMAANGPDIYNITTAYPGPAAKPTALFTHRNSDFTWVGFAEGQKFIYAAGFSGDKSTIYKTQVQPEGTALTVPVIAGELPDGEIIRSIQGYLGYILLGSDLGVRFCAVTSDGDLTIGSLLRTTSPVLSFEPQDRFVWYGWTNYDGASTGLGRLDLQTFTSLLTPAYASDLMAIGQGSVTSITTFQNRRVFTVAGAGVFVEDLNSKVVSGTLDTGLFTFSAPDPKTLLLIDFRYKVLSGTHTVYVAKSDGVFVSLGSHTNSSDAQFSAGQLRSDAFEIRNLLTRDATLTNLAPIIARHTLKGSIAIDAGQNIFVPFLLTERDKLPDGTQVARNPMAELDYLKQLRADQSSVIYQEGDHSYTVILSDYDWFPSHLAKNKNGYNGTCVVELRISGN